MTDATPINDDDLRMFALAVQKQHDAKQQDHGYNRCVHCGFTRHPCDTFDLATAVLALLDRQPARDLDGEIIVTKTGRVMTEGEIATLADEAEAGYDVSHLRGQ